MPMKQPRFKKLSLISLCYKKKATVCSPSLTMLWEVKPYFYIPTLLTRKLQLNSNSESASVLVWVNLWLFFFTWNQSDTFINTWVSGESDKKYLFTIASGKLSCFPFHFRYAPMTTAVLCAEIKRQNSFLHVE